MRNSRTEAPITFVTGPATISSNEEDSVQLVHMKMPASTTATVCLIAAALDLPPAAEPRREFQLQAQSPQFWNLVDHNAKLSVVATGFGFTEGPVWDDAGFLYLSD